MSFIPPAVMRVHIVSQGRTRVGLWIPFFLLWPLFLVMLAIVLPLALVAEIILYPTTGIRPASLTLALVDTLASLRGLSVNIKQSTTNDRVIVHM
jgi:hypothetical protein